MQNQNIKTRMAPSTSTPSLRLARVNKCNGLVLLHQRNAKSNAKPDAIKNLNVQES